MKRQSRGSGQDNPQLSSLSEPSKLTPTSHAKSNIPNTPSAPPSPPKTRNEGGGQPSAPMPPPAHLHLLPDVLPVGEEVVERVLGVLHVAAVLAVNQQPVEGEITNLIGNTCWQL